MSDQNDFDIMSDPLVQVSERVADELERMAEIAYARNFTEEEVDAYAEQAIIVWQCRRNA
ncbi:hypothetical protein [Brevibacterium renqingii]|uniref:hypothetical protein n=1 Tax=Brevibacterium renqingii TaxID=2776916 RepID=UPI001ADF5E9E|nr:hypothetical protein [Brevibacterium renqingii]